MFKEVKEGATLYQGMATVEEGRVVLEDILEGKVVMMVEMVAVAVSHRAALQQQRGPAAALPLLVTRPASRRSPVRPRLQLQDQAPHFRVPTNSRVLQPPLSRRSQGCMPACWVELST